MSDPYLSAEQLRISEEERTALIATIDVLKAEAVYFDMSLTCRIRSGHGSYTDPAPPCRTSCCIGGTMGLLMQNGMKLPEIITHEMRRAASKYVMSLDPTGYEPELEPPIVHLFYGSLFERDHAKGAKAVERFLLGEDPWRQS